MSPLIMDERSWERRSLAGKVDIAMPMNKDLLAKIGAKLHVKNGRIYELVAKKASTLALPRDLAIFLVAADHEVNYQKFATKTQLESIRGALGNGNNRNSASEPMSAVPNVSRARAIPES